MTLRATYVGTTDANSMSHAVHLQLLRRRLICVSDAATLSTPPTNTASVARAATTNRTLGCIPIRSCGIRSCGTTVTRLPQNHFSGKSRKDRRSLEVLPRSLGIGFRLHATMAFRASLTALRSELGARPPGTSQVPLTARCRLLGRSPVIHGVSVGVTQAGRHFHASRVGNTSGPSPSKKQDVAEEVPACKG